VRVKLWGFLKNQVITRAAPAPRVQQSATLAVMWAVGNTSPDKVSPCSCCVIAVGFAIPVGSQPLRRQSGTRHVAIPRHPKRFAALVDLRALPAAVLGFFLPFFGFGGCIAAARSGAELAAALLHAASASCWSHHRTCFFGFSGCGAAACSGAELAAALLLAFRPPKSFRAAARSACASASHASLAVILIYNRPAGVGRGGSPRLSTEALSRGGRGGRAGSKVSRGEGRGWLARASPCALGRRRRQRASRRQGRITAGGEQAGGAWPACAAAHNSPGGWRGSHTCSPDRRLAAFGRAPRARRVLALRRWVWWESGSPLSQSAARLPPSSMKR